RRLRLGRRWRRPCGPSPLATTTRSWPPSGEWARWRISAIPALEALNDDRLRAAPDGRVFIFDSKQRDILDPLTGKVVSPRPDGIREVEGNNEYRRVVLPVLAQLQLGAPDEGVRLGAAQELANRGSPE